MNKKRGQGAGRGRGQLHLHLHLHPHLHCHPTSTTVQLLVTLLFTIECYAIVLMTNVQKMGELINLLGDVHSTWQLLHIISASIPNICTKTTGGVQHNGTPSAYAYALHKC
jgi:hypothetical protein